MRLSKKCLSEITVIVLVSLLLINFSECKPQFGLNDVLGPPSNDDALMLESDKLNTERGDQNKADTGLDELEKRMGRLTAWGTRNIPSEYGDDPNADLHHSDKRGWFKFNSWGKRSDDELENEKRKWSNFASWGKRNGEDIAIDPEKRKWSSFASWGKRYNDDEQDLDSVRDSDSFEADKRKWSNFVSWGKRDLELVNPDKRKWSSFASWGKRDGLEDNLDKRRWSQFSSWGKRKFYPYDWAKRRWAQFNSWGKRRWAGLATWGKRSAPGLEEDDIAESIVTKLLQFFDVNGEYKIKQGHE